MTSPPFPWRDYLPQLQGFPLLPCGAGTDGKAPLDPATGQPARNWQTAAYSPADILALNGVVTCCGTRTGPDAGGLLVFDIDGQSAIDHCTSLGCDPFAAPSWHIVRDTDTTRLKVCYRLPQDLWAHLGTIKRKHVTRPADDTSKGEQVELFFGRGQIIVLGHHRESGGHYYWPQGHTPDDLTEPPPSWLALALSIAAGGRQEAPQRGRIALDGHQQGSQGHTQPVDELTRARDAIQALDPAMGNDEWIQVGMAVHAIDDGPAGFTVWDDWSRGCPSKYDHHRVTSAWKGFTRGGGITDRSLFKKARQAGWRDPFVRSPNTTHAGGRQEPQEGATAPAQGDPPARRYSELLDASLDAAQAGDQDTYAETVAELMVRFRVGASAVQAALMRLLTARHSGNTTPPSAGYVDITDVEHLEHLLPGFIAAREQSLLHAPKGTGKTLAALAVAKAITLGTGLLDHSEPAHQGRVLYLATDSGCASMHTQMQEIGLLELPEFTPCHPDQRFFIRGHHARQGVSAWEATIPEILWLLHEVQQQRFDLVIIDSAKACLSLTDLDYTDNRAVGSLLTLFQRVICPHAAVLWLHHDGRENGHNAGAKVWAELPVIVHRLERVEPPKPKHGGSGEDDQGPPPSAPPRRWVCVKSRVAGDERSFIYTLQPTGEFEVAPDVEIIGNCSEAVLQVLEQAMADGQDSLPYAQLVGRVADLSGRSMKTVKNTITRMKGGREPDIRLCAPGRYTLTPRARVRRGVCVYGTKSKERVVIDRLLVGPDPVPTGTPSGPFQDPESPDQSRSGPPPGPTKPIGTTGESRKSVPTHTHPSRAGARGTAAADPTNGSGLGDPSDRLRLSEGPQHPPNAPDWFDRLVQLRRERPTDLPATLALALDPAATGCPTGAEVKRWLPAADQLLTEGGAADA